MEERRTVRISEKRQFTIPVKFYNALDFSSEAECFLRDGEIVIKPKSESVGDELSEHILKELIGKGLTGEELLSAFKTERDKAAKAIKKIKKEAVKVSKGKAEYSTFDEVFGKDNQNE